MESNVNISDHSLSLATQIVWAAIAALADSPRVIATAIIKANDRLRLGAKLYESLDELAALGRIEKRGKGRYAHYAISDTGRAVLERKMFVPQSSLPDASI